MKQANDNAIANWLNRRTAHWQRLQQLVQKQGDSHNEPIEEVMQLVQGSRELARDLSLARTVLPNSKVRQYLEALFVRMHDAIYRRPQALGQTLKKIYTQEVPAVMQQMRGVILAVLVIFLGSALAGWLLVDNNPETITIIASEGMINTVNDGKLWTDDLLNVMPSSVLSLSIMTNNIMVSLFAFVFGALYGIGTLYMMVLNGFMLGSIFAYTYRYDLAGRLFDFVFAHGVVELSVIILAGAAGVRLGEALVRPGDRPRSEAVQKAVAQAGRLLFVIVPFLIGAGVIEGYVSPDHGYDRISRIVIGLGYGVLLWAVLYGHLWKFGRKQS
jgi:uncharacterized membrane protein SpoIIM required for sporulation